MPDEKTIKLNDGSLMPTIGLGTSKCTDDEVFAAVRHAIHGGYRLIDCSIFYGNEEAVGRAVRSKIDEGAVKREELFITGKLWRSFNRKEHVDECVNASLKNLQIDHFDLYLVHYPKAIAYGGLKDLLPKDGDGVLIKDEGCDYVDTWRSVQRVREDGRSRSLGVSNFNEFQLQRLIRETGVVPAVNQVEFHPYLTQPGLVGFCGRHRIAVTAYCCVGAADRKAREWKNKQEEFVHLLDDPVIVGLAGKHGKSPAQVCLRFCVEMGVAAVPKSVTASRITENLDVFDFRLSGEEVEKILSLNRNHRFLPADADEDHKFHPFRENYSE